ncbi:hypothetical protein HanIR_Chr09g0392021 [Helianthus annuus]|nr:hypothetical protein HanIR_Chr09g0392021 [Helianthus annuus]
MILWFLRLHIDLTSSRGAIAKFHGGRSGFPRIYHTNFFFSKGCARPPNPNLRSAPDLNPIPMQPTPSTSSTSSSNSAVSTLTSTSTSDEVSTGAPREDELDEIVELPSLGEGYDSADSRNDYVFVDSGWEYYSSTTAFAADWGGGYFAGESGTFLTDEYSWQHY